MKTFLTVIAVLLILAAGVLTYLLTGSYNVAATEPHWDITHDLLEVVRERSIEAHSRGINAPPLKDYPHMREGFVHFHNVCRICHGAPGYNRAEFAMGLYPLPPDLGSPALQEEFTDAQIYWVAKHGLKMTGMPSMAEASHGDGDRELWGIVAFVRKLAELQDEEYRAMVRKEGLSEAEPGAHEHGHEQGGGHGHGDGGREHDAHRNENSGAH